MVEYVYTRVINFCGLMKWLMDNYWEFCLHIIITKLMVTESTTLDLVNGMGKFVVELTH